MYKTMVLMLVIVMSQNEVCCRRKIEDYAEAFDCHNKCPEKFNCQCEEENWTNAKPECIPFSYLCDAAADCTNEADEVDCICSPNQHQCGSDRGGNMTRLSNQYHCISDTLVNDGDWDCWDGSDESDNSSCNNPVQCDGYVDCDDAVDERNCTKCPLNRPNFCKCNQPNNFSCGEGFACYSKEAKCDGYFQCSDGSDEDGCNCEKDLFSCDCYEVKSKSCSSGGCISSICNCDGDFDCSDGSDEEGCTCRDDQFTCACYKADPKSCSNPGCIPLKQQCDGNPDCEDGSDEERCKSCGKDRFTCDCNKIDSKACSGEGCISMDRLCNGLLDCSDGSDEEDCTTCREDMFTCNCYKINVKACNGRGCVLESERCDGKLDCSDNSDEEGCTCKKHEFSCDCYTTKPKSCTGLGCIPTKEKCDGKFNCNDRSDEKKCSCDDDQFTCACYKTEPKSCSIDSMGCLSRSDRCNGKIDCSDGSDERNCSCEKKQFTCTCYEADPQSCSVGKSGCVLMSQHCDGEFDCSDGSDETNCRCKREDFTCDCYNDHPKSCSSAGCVSNNTRCDTHADCSDRSDEKGCTCENDQFTCECYNAETNPCLTGGCISLNKRCDGESDCFDGSDENACTNRAEDIYTCDCYTNKSCSNVGCVSLSQHCNGFRDFEDGSDETECTCKKNQFTCDCYNTSTKSCLGRGCFSMVKKCDGIADCEDGSDEKDCNCTDRQFTCDCYNNVPKTCNSTGCIANVKHCDGLADCEDGSDERNCTCRKDQFTCDCYKSVPKVCTKRGCISRSQHCDEDFDCEDDSDEEDCTCREDQFTCDCFKTNSSTCLSGGCILKSQQCDGLFDCSDRSDEINCTSCRENLYTCDCYRTHNKSCETRGCIPINKLKNKEFDCSDRSDELTEDFKITKYKDQNIIIRRFATVEKCDDYTDCNKSYCVNLCNISCVGYTKKCNSSQVICTTLSNKLNRDQASPAIFQCENGHLEIAHNFCDGKIDCSDRSDEKGNIPGFKCSASFGRCVLPQINLHDSVAQCNDGSDLCQKESCFHCLDGRLTIAQTQVCDGNIDCFDLSDECLCNIYLREKVCDEMFVGEVASQMLCGKLNTRCNKFTSLSIKIARCNSTTSSNQSNNSISSGSEPASKSSSVPVILHIICQNKTGKTIATTCDGRPECRDLSDECFCVNRPTFCQSRCHDFYPLGNQYCDGIIDEAWKFIDNNSSCPEGFDEKSCPQRFTCKAGNLVSIDRVQVCDGRVDCDDGSDELGCKKKSRDAIFSSDAEMIANIELRIIFWFMSFFVIFGNCVVIFPTMRLLCKEKMSEGQALNHMLILNLSFSDFLMGIYLLLISVKGVSFSGVYGKFDYQWRASIECSLIGSLAVISSETSCFIMTILTAFRLYNVFNPFTARIASTKKWKLGIILAWSISLVLALLPLLKATSNYFVHEIWFSNPWTSNEDEGWKKSDVMTFACRLAALSNHSFVTRFDEWEETRNYLQNPFADYSPRGEVGYYGETSVCMPRIYASRGDQAWMYSFVIIVFNFASFLFVALSYLFIYCKASHRPMKTSACEEQSIQMQKRITRLIATDFACWIPICFMVYLKTGGVDISNMVYTVTAGVLLPINSALNPLLYSPIVENYLGKLCFKRG